MHHAKPTLGRLLGAAGVTCTLVFAVLGLASLPAGAQSAATSTCPFVSLENPNPGDLLNFGGYIVAGTAYDPAATQGSGIARIDFFLGERESGGIFLGSATPGSGGAGSNPNAFTVELQIPKPSHAIDFVAYAVSSVTNQQTTVTVPVFVGASPSSGAEAGAVAAGETTTCPAAAASAPGAASSVPASTPAAVPPQAASTNGCPVLSLGNPGPGDHLNPGGYVISGTAYDPNATSGSGVTRVDFFLDPRDTGGQFLGSAVPGSNSSNPTAFSTTVQVPNLGRGKTFSAYAISAVTGQETVIMFSVLVGIPPTSTSSSTATPVPTNTTTTMTCH